MCGVDSFQPILGKNDMRMYTPFSVSSLGLSIVLI